MWMNTNSIFHHHNLNSECGEAKEVYRRISNGPLEGFNRKIKDTKRLSRGYFNFDFFRQRILWHARDNALILGIPKTEKEIHNHTYIKRGKYNKK